MPVIIAALLAASPAAARPVGERVALVKTERDGAAWAELEHRIAVELEAAGFEVVLVEVPQGADLTQVSKEQGTVAALRVTTGASVTVQVVDRATGKSSQRELQAARARPPARLALQAVELLYASLLELESSSTPVAGAVPSVSARRVARRKLQAPLVERSFSLRGGVMAMAAPGGLGTLAGLELGALVHPFRMLGAGVSLAATAPNVVREGDASAWFAAGLARAIITFEPWPEAHVSPSLEARLGGVLGLSDGESESGAPTRLDQGATPSAGLALGLAVSLRRDFRLRASFELSRGVEALSVRFAGRSVARLDRQWYGVSLGTDWLY